MPNNDDYCIGNMNGLVSHNELLYKSCIVATITYCVIIFIAHQINDYTCSKNRTYFQFHVHKKIDSRLTKTHQGSTTHLTLIVCICFQTTASTCLKWYLLNKMASISIKLLFPLTQYVLESNLKPSTTYKSVWYTLEFQNRTVGNMSSTIAKGLLFHFSFITAGHITPFFPSFSFFMDTVLSINVFYRPQFENLKNSIVKPKGMYEL